jgi:hypothetical protein
VTGDAWIAFLAADAFDTCQVDADELGPRVQELGALLQRAAEIAVHIVSRRLLITTAGTFDTWQVLHFHGDKETRAQVVAEKFHPGAFDVVVTSYASRSRLTSDLGEVHL